MTPTRVAGPGRRSSAPVAPSSAEPAVYSRLHSLSAETTNSHCSNTHSYRSWPG